MPIKTGISGITGKTKPPENSGGFDEVRVGPRLCRVKDN